MVCIIPRIISYFDAFHTFSKKSFLERCHDGVIFGPLLLKDPTVLEMMVQITLEEHRMPTGLQLPQFIHLLEVYFGRVVLLRLQDFLDDFMLLNFVGLHETLQILDVTSSEEDKGVLSLVGLIFFFWVQSRSVVFAPPRPDYRLVVFALSMAGLSNRKFWLCFYWLSNGYVCSWRHLKVDLIIVVDLMQGVSLLRKERRVELLGLPLICLHQKL